MICWAEHLVTPIVMLLLFFWGSCTWRKQKRQEILSDFSYKLLKSIDGMMNFVKHVCDPLLHYEEGVSTEDRMLKRFKEGSETWKKSIEDYYFYYRNRYFILYEEEEIQSILNKLHEKLSKLDSLFIELQSLVGSDREEERKSARKCLREIWKIGVDRDQELDPDVPGSLRRQLCESLGKHRYYTSKRGFLKWKKK